MKKKLSPNINNQALSNILATTILSGINFFTIPIFTRMLGAANYGKYSVFHSWVVILMCIMGMETQAAGGTARYVFKDDHDGYMSSCLFLGTLSCGVFIVLGTVFRGFLSQVLGLPPMVVVMMFLCAFGQYVVGFAKTKFIYQKRAELNLVVSVALSLATVLLSMLLIHMSRSSELYLARVYGVSLPYVITAVVLWIYIFRKKPVFYNKSYWSYCLTMGLPLIFHILANDVLKQSDKVMLQFLGAGDAAVGIYSFLCTYTGIVQIILTALNTSWCPFYYDDLSENAMDKLAKKCRNYLELFTVLACGFLLLSREVGYLFAGEEYWSGLDVIPILVIGIYFIFMYQFEVNFEFYHKKTKIIAAGTIVAALSNILLNLLLIPRFGMYGAAIATATAYGMLFVVHFCIANHLKEMKFHMKLTDFMPWLASVFAVIVLFYVLKDFWYVRWILGGILGVFELYRIVKRKSIF